MDDYEDLIGWEGLYKINRGGSVWSVRNKREMKSVMGNRGYYQICLCKDGEKENYYIHRLIALQYIPNDRPEITIEIDHINRIRTDNRLENLRWATKSENQRNKPKKKNGSISHHQRILRASWSYYEGDIRVVKTKSSKDRAVLEAWLEQMKIDHP